MIAIPVQVAIQLNPQDLPPGPPGPPGVLRQRRTYTGAAGAETSSLAFVGTGHKVLIRPLADGTVHVQAQGVVGHAQVGAIVHFTLLRNGIAVPLPAGWSGLTAARVRDSSNVEPFSLAFFDAPGVCEDFEYELAWRVHAASACLGKRPGDSTIFAPVTMIAEEIAA